MHAATAEPRFWQWARAWVAVVSLSACGSHTPEVPPELLNRDCDPTGQYPAGPFGREPGDTAQNLEFQGFRAPQRAVLEAAQLERVRFSDYYDPKGTQGVRLLLVNTAAVWCAACQVEHRTLPLRSQQYAENGLVILSALFQDATRQPARFEHLKGWIDVFGTNFPMVLDPEYKMGAFGSPEVAPLNLVIDARDMKILQVFVGDQEAALWAFIDARL